MKTSTGYTINITGVDNTGRHAILSTNLDWLKFYVPKKVVAKLLKNIGTEAYISTFDDIYTKGVNILTAKSIGLKTLGKIL